MFRYVTRDTLVPIRRLYTSIPNGSRFKLTRAARDALIQSMAHDVLMEKAWIAMDEPFKGIKPAEREQYGKFKKMRALFTPKASDAEWKYLEKTCRDLVEGVLKSYSLLTTDMGLGLVVAFNRSVGYELFINRDCLVIRTYCVQYNGKTYTLEEWPARYIESLNSKKIKYTFDSFFENIKDVTCQEVKHRMSYMDNHDLNYLLQKAIERG